MQIEDIPRIGFTPWRSTHQEREFSVGARVAGQVVVHHQGILPPVAEELAHGRGCERGQVLQARWAVRAGHHDHGA